MQPTITRLTATEFMEIEHDYPYLRELLDGEIILSGSPKTIHNRFLARVYNQVDSRKPNGEVVFAPMGVFLTNIDVPQPYLFWVMEGGHCVDGGNGYYGAPALIVEVLSPSTAKRDRGYKFRLYETSGVQEYWIGDAEDEFIEVYTLVEGRYWRVGLFEKGETFLSPILGKEIMVPSAE